VDEERLLKAVGDRVRDVRQGPDGALSVVTDDNSNGRVLKLVPKRPSQ
jgi:glucose/arabinose dehydrogenase